MQSNCSEAVTQSGDVGFGGSEGVAAGWTDASSRWVGKGLLG